MNIKFLLPILLVFSIIPAFGALSEATGLVNRFNIETGGYVFEITTTANFDVKNVDFDKDQKQLTFHMVSSIENNLGEIIIPNTLLSGNFTFLLNDQEYFPKVMTNDKISFITLNFTGLGENKLDVIGTKYLEGDDETVESISGDVDSDIDSQTDGGGCLIATATFGSELAPQVQQLREIRDNKLTGTESGSAFIHSFNEIYYSFSPQVADYERENPLFKEMIKLTITPLISSLSLLNYVDLDSDEQILGYGSSLILLNLGMYFGVPYLVYLRLKK